MSLNFNEDCSKIYPNEFLDNDSKESSNEDYNEKLRNRINMLRETMQDLKAQLKDEKDSWEKELQEVNNFENMEAPIKNDIPNLNCTHNLTVYEDPMDYIYVESKNLQRQLAISNYRRRLLEVENMCNLELMRVKQNVTFLQPLRMIASEWELHKEPDECGECVYPPQKSFDQQVLDENKLNELSNVLEFNNKYAGDTNTFSKINDEVNEISQLPNKLNYLTQQKRLNSRSGAWYTEYITTE